MTARMRTRHFSYAAGIRYRYRCACASIDAAKYNVKDAVTTIAITILGKHIMCRILPGTKPKPMQTSDISCLIASKFCRE